MQMSNKLYYLPMFVDDYLADTWELTVPEHGAYCLLIYHYWRSEGPIEESRIPGILRGFNEWETVRPNVEKYFDTKSIPGFWVHNRLERELKKAKSMVEKNKSKAKKAASVRWEKCS